MIRTRAAFVGLALVVVSAGAAADPTKPECLAANDKAQDLRQAGKLKAAREQLAVCVAQSCPGPVRDDCVQRLAEIATVQPSIVFAVKDSAGDDLSAVNVTVDGQPFAEKLDGAALAVDPGDHTFRFEGVGAVTNKHIVVREGEKGRREAVVLGAKSTATGSSAALGEHGGMGTQKTLGLVVGGVGVAGLVVGSIFGVVAKSTSNSPATAGRVSLVDASEWGSDIGFGIGIAGVVAGTILFFTAPRESHGGHAAASVRPWIGPGCAGFEGRF